MNKKFKIFTLCQKGSFIDRAKLIGFAFWIAMESQAYRAFRLIDFKFWVIPAIDHKQILFFFDDFDNPIGYVIWANIAPDSEQRLLKDSSFLLHESEWDEGNRTWIIDCCFPYGSINYAVAEIRNFFKSQDIDRFFWARRNMDYSVRKVVECVV
ncbi:toxin-activating lysine-acyltransferase [Pseudomonas chlororaphis]|uniref:toxin-activating lysine-acyltransferase n=1 Tax=Pseudomonas chlororaphis TaxID=587753 RepID=UPI002408304D|nr:toxin-activating lysine-acyltransferase [Pseudomonas chlororaphis]